MSLQAQVLSNWSDGYVPGFVVFQVRGGQLHFKSHMTVIDRLALRNVDERRRCIFDTPASSGQVCLKGLHCLEQDLLGTALDWEGLERGPPICSTCSQTVCLLRLISTLQNRCVQRLWPHLCAKQLVEQHSWLVSPLYFSWSSHSAMSSFPLNVWFVSTRACLSFHVD